MIQRIATPSQTKAILEKHDLYAKKITVKTSWLSAASLKRLPVMR